MPAKNEGQQCLTLWTALPAPFGGGIDPAVLLREDVS